jgi:hypothetical protein
MNIFGLNPVVVFGNDEQRARFLPPLIQGKDKACFGVTEPNSGLDTSKLETRAVLQGDHYQVHGRKIWISTAQVANKILLLARTTALSEVKSQRTAYLCSIQTWIAAPSKCVISTRWDAMQWIRTCYLSTGCVFLSKIVLVKKAKALAICCTG